MSSSQRVKVILMGLFLVFALVLASCGPLAARVDTGGGESVVGVRHGMEINLEDVPPTGVPVLCNGQAPAGVASIELHVNGMFMGRSSNTAAPGTHEFTYFTAVMSFEPDGPGAYELRCRTQDQEGRTFNSADVTIFLIGEVPTSTTAPPEVPTATSTSTEAPAPEVPTATSTSTEARPPEVPTDTPTSTARPTDTATSTPTSTATTPVRVVITMFEASKTQITAGDCPVTFSWQVQAPTAIYFDGEGVTSNPGSKNRCPEFTRTYELVAEGYLGPVTASITIVVIQPPSDTEGPNIGRFAHSPGKIFWDQYDSCDPIQVSINAYNITDPSGVEAVKVAYRVVDGKLNGQWQAKPMSQVQTGVWSATIGPNDLELSLYPPVTQQYGEQSTLHYYIQAFDGVGNRSDSSTRTLIVEYCYIIG